MKFGNGDLWVGIFLVNLDIVFWMVDVGFSVDNKEEVIFYLFCIWIFCILRMDYFCYLWELLKNYVIMVMNELF